MKSSTRMTVLLEDRQQDTLWLKVTPDGIVDEAGPFQNWLWRNGRVLNLTDLKKGSPIDFQFEGREPSTLRYACVGVRRGWDSKKRAIS